MVNGSSILAWEIPWTEEPGVLWSMGHKESDVTEHACKSMEFRYNPSRDVCKVFQVTRN